ncbi:hypothetical protein BGZ68_010638 [Mortierella alpina]|nr:hypothetical protein BGZ68_010638 [Mortierella alpina]
MKNSSSPPQRNHVLASTPRRGCASNDESSVDKTHQDIVFAIPELLSLITTYLDTSDFLALILVCRAWNAFWLPHVYSKLSLCEYKRSGVYPTVENHGDHVKALTLQCTQWNNILHLLHNTPNVTSLAIHHSPINFAQLQQILCTVPRLRTFRMVFGRECVEPHECPAILASMLPDLEELAWKGESIIYYGGYSKVRVEDILHILKTCTKLRSLRLANILNTESELRDQKPVLINEDEEWRSRSLQLLECDNVLLGSRRSHQGTAKHSWIRRLLHHAPGIRRFIFTGSSYLHPLDWESVFESAVNLENVELWPYNAPCAAGDFSSNTADAIAALSPSCNNLKVLNVRYAHGTTDQLLEQIIRANRHLQRLCVKETGFGDASLKELVRISSVLSATSTPADNLVQLDMEGCHQVTSAGALPILENCRFLKDLNLAGTSAGTLELFDGNRPWACVKSLETLKVDIEPIGFQPLSSLGARRCEGVVPTPSTVLYSRQEQLTIRERLRSLRFLTVLDLRGSAMEFAILDDASFAPRLRMINITVPCREQQDPSPSSRFSLMEARVEEIGSRLFPPPAVSVTGTSVMGDRVAWKISAMIGMEMMTTSTP